MQSTAELEAFAPFQNLSATGLASLRRGLQYAHCAKTTTLLHKGQQVSGAYIVLRGQLRVFTLTPNGNEATLYLINPGETCVLALNCIFNDLLYPAWVQASSATKVAIIPGTSYRLLFESEAAIRGITVQAFSTLVFRLMTELEGMHTFKLEQRLANFLLLHASTDGTVRMTQQQIASHLGTSREVIARPLRQLVAQRYIETKRHHILLKSPAKLVEVVRGTREASVPANSAGGKRSRPRR
ncbi:MAG: Crp/Fnr family transcriptional regulator [Gammaproteobacteria bacterium]|nr:Crp/Fnr family transcriptional regulator [Gammaproteobacteria bacterium]